MSVLYSSFLLKSLHVRTRLCLCRAEEPSGLTLLEAHIFQRGRVAVCFGISESRLPEKQPGRSSSTDDDDFPRHSESSAEDGMQNVRQMEICN